VSGFSLKFNTHNIINNYFFLLLRKVAATIWHYILINYTYLIHVGNLEYYVTWNMVIYALAGHTASMTGKDCIQKFGWDKFWITAS
jgi:hypothetical protein